MIGNKSLAGKKVAFIIAFSNFNGDEYFVPRGILENAGATIETVSNGVGRAVGTNGKDTQIDLLLENLNPADFDAIIFIGGSGCLENLDNEKSYRVVRETVSQNKVLASICISPVILAKAGVLRGKKATVWSSAQDQSPVNILKEGGAIYEAKPVIQDGNIITATDPSAINEFTDAILNTLLR